MGAIFIGILCALLGFGYIHLFIRYLEEDQTLIITVLLICLILGFMMTVIIEFIFLFPFFNSVTNFYFFGLL